MEKFALLNLLKALDALAPKKEKEDAPPPQPQDNAEPPAPAPAKDEKFNAMASVLSRHEQISNRLKNKNCK